LLLLQFIALVVSFVAGLALFVDGLESKNS